MKRQSTWTLAILSTFVFSYISWAQAQSPAPNPADSKQEPIELYNDQKPDINIYEEQYNEESQLNPYNPQAPYNPYINSPYPPSLYNPQAPYIPGQASQTQEPASLARLSGGVALLMTNVGIVQSTFKQTNDSVYTRSNASEFGFGLNGFLDFSPPQGPGAFRIRAGASRVQIKPNSATKARYSSAQLENSETLFNLAMIYRVSLPSEMIGFGVFWAGAGFQMLYAMSTSRISSGSSTGGSKLANSYGYSPLLSLGSELPFTSTEDFSLGFDYVPFKGFNLTAGIKTAL